MFFSFFFYFRYYFYFFFCFFFFFSSRRRHTRLTCDWEFRRVLFRSARAVTNATIEVGTNSRREVVKVDGVDVRERIRGAEVTRAVSPVSAVPAVRRLLVARQRERSEERRVGKECRSRGSPDD